MFHHSICKTHFALRITQSLLIFLLFMLGTVSRLQSQSTLFTLTTQPATLNDGQTKVLNYATTSPHLNSLRFVQMASANVIDQSGNFNFSIPGVNSGNPMTFEVQSAVFDDPQHYSITASGINGYVTLYFTPEGVGGTIDLITRLFTLMPFDGGKALLVERTMNDANSPICGKEIGISDAPLASFCSGDCGADILDILILRTPQANTWLTSTYGSLAEWFLYTEGHNINLALNNSDVLNKGFE